MSAEATDQFTPVVQPPKKKDKLLVRLRPQGKQQTWGFRSTIMKRGVFYKTTSEICRKLFQFKTKDGQDCFEACSIRAAFAKLQEEKAPNPHDSLSASELPAYFNELVDQGAIRQAHLSAQRQGSLDSLYREALNSDLLLSSDDAAFLKAEILNGGGMTESSTPDSAVMARINHLEGLISKMANANSLNPADFDVDPDARKGVDSFGDPELGKGPPSLAAPSEETFRDAEEGMLLDADLEEPSEIAEPPKKSRAKKTTKRAAAGKKTSTKKKASSKKTAKRGAPRLRGGAAK